MRADTVKPDASDQTAVAEGSSIERTAATFAGGNLVATVLRLITGVLTSRFVDPSTLGLFNGIGLVRGYVPLLLLGVNNGLNRELPYHVGCGDRKQVSLLAATAQAWSLIIGTLAGIGVLSVALYHMMNGRWQLFAGWATFSLVSFLVIFGDTFLASLFRSCGEFVPLAKLSVVRAALRGVMVLLVWGFGFYGLCLREFILVLFVLSFLWRLRPLKERPRLHKNELRRLGKTGAPIFVVGQLDKLWGVLNATLVLKLAGAEGLGLYVIANLVGPTIVMIPQALSQVVYPRMSEQYGRSGQIADLVKMAKRPVLHAVLFTGALAIATWMALPPLVDLVLPKYVGGIRAGQWAAISTIVLSLIPFNNIFNVIRKQRLYAGTMLTGIICYFIALLVLTRNGPYLEAFPQAMLLGRSVYIAASLLLIRHFIKRQRIEERHSCEPD